MEKVRPFDGKENDYFPRPQGDIDKIANRILQDDANISGDALTRRVDKAVDGIVEKNEKGDWTRY